MSERSAVDQKSLDDAPPEYFVRADPPAAILLLHRAGPSFYRIWWTGNFARPMPFMPVDATNVTTVSSVVTLEMLPVTTVMVDLRASLATTASSGCTFTIGDYNGYTSDDMVVPDGPDKLIVRAPVPVTNRSFRSITYRYRQQHAAAVDRGFRGRQRRPLLRFRL